MKKDIIYKDESYNIIGAAIDVHNELGHGFLETVYQEALEIEFKIKNIPYKREALLQINYKNRSLNKKYIADFICYDKIIIEIKALSTITSEHKSQVINYLKATNMELGIIINFGQNKLNYERIIRIHSR